ncbi:MAG: hypothetical protein MZV70_18850 [Desulfobacterales bacterium]|nr:hypothetical protein [Desulfobacterales bacterium]
MEAAVFRRAAADRRSSWASCMARRWPLEQMAAAVCGAVGRPAPPALWVVGLFTGQGLARDALPTASGSNLELTLQLYREMGLSPEQIDFLEELAGRDPAGHGRHDAGAGHRLHPDGGRGSAC